jgi:RING finger/CHY zinc finger protein 1
VKTATFETHGCALNAARNDCTICLDSLHASRDPIQFLPCGHGLHARCFQEFLESGQRCCPLCKKMVVSTEYQRLVIDQTDEDIALAPMPEEYRDKRVRIRCNECRQESVTPFHVFGLKCMATPLGEASCGGSYNTVKIGEAHDDPASEAEQPPPS